MLRGASAIMVPDSQMLAERKKHLICEQDLCETSLFLPIFNLVPDPSILSGSVVGSRDWERALPGFAMTQWVLGASHTRQH